MHTNTNTNIYTVPRLCRFVVYFVGKLFVVIAVVFVFSVAVTKTTAIPASVQRVSSEWGKEKKARELLSSERASLTECARTSEI